MILILAGLALVVLFVVTGLSGGSFGGSSGGSSGGVGSSPGSWLRGYQPDPGRKSKGGGSGTPPAGSTVVTLTFSGAGALVPPLAGLAADMLGAQAVRAMLSSSRDAEAAAVTGVRQVSKVATNYGTVLLGFDQVFAQVDFLVDADPLTAVAKFKASPLYAEIETSGQRVVIINGSDITIDMGERPEGWHGQWPPGGNRSAGGNSFNVPTGTWGFRSGGSSEPIEGQPGGILFNVLSGMSVNVTINGFRLFPFQNFITELVEVLEYNLTHQRLQLVVPVDVKVKTTSGG